MTSRDLAALLLHARRQTGFDVESAARKAGVGTNTVRNWESCQGLSTLVGVSRLLAVYGLELSVKRASSPLRPVTDSKILEGTAD